MRYHFLYLEINSLANVQQECTIFNGVTYLGSATINAPKSECEIQRNMNILNAEQSLNLGIKVSVSVPSSSQGSVVYVQLLEIVIKYFFHRTSCIIMFV